MNICHHNMRLGDRVMRRFASGHANFYSGKYLGKYCKETDNLQRTLRKILALLFILFVPYSSTVSNSFFYDPASELLRLQFSASTPAESCYA